MTSSFFRAAKKDWAIAVTQKIPECPAERLMSRALSTVPKLREV